MGSIGGGGRYDNLTGIFGLKGISGVGISFGADRIYDVLSELNLFPSTVNVGVKVLIINFGQETLSTCLKTLQQLRNAGIAAEMYPTNIKVGKQLTTPIRKISLLLSSSARMKLKKYVQTQKYGNRRAKRSECRRGDCGFVVMIRNYFKSDRNSYISQHFRLWIDNIYALEGLNIGSRNEEINRSFYVKTEGFLRPTIRNGGFR